MPNLSGYDCFYKLKEISKEVKILIASGYAADIQTQKLLDDGACDLLQKPFIISDLFKSVNAILKSKNPG